MKKSITEQLEELFKKWIEKQKKESEYNCERTGIAKDSFTPDGIVNEKKWNQLKGEKKVLYLLREANGNTSKMNEDGNGAHIDDGKFWFKQCVEDGNIGNKIFNRIAEMQGIIQNNTKSNKIDLLNQVAYMNINKRGGGSTVDWKILNDYAHNYKKQILKEICILKPDIIVCCGTYWTFVDNICEFYRNGMLINWEPCDEKDFVLDETISFEGDECKCKIINMYHPSAIMSNQKYIERFKQLWSKEMMTIDKNVVLDKDKIIEVIRNLDEKSEQYFDLCEFIKSIPLE